MLVVVKAETLEQKAWEHVWVGYWEGNLGGEAVGEEDFRVVKVSMDGLGVAGETARRKVLTTVFLPPLSDSGGEAGAAEY
jgi:hypothetical protein